MLPASWIMTTLGDISAINPAVALPSGFTDSTSVSFVPMAAVDDVTGTITAAQKRPVGEVWRGYKRFEEGDVLFAKITPCMENGKAAIATSLLNGLGLGSTEFHVLRPSPAVEAKWLYYYVRQVSFRRDAERAMTGTAGQLRVPASFMETAPIPLAPLEEQRRVAAEIERQLTRLDAAVAVLKRAQANLRRYKAAVLKAACEGKLVPQDPNDEPASELLKRILTERRAKWEEEMRARGKDPRKVKQEEPAFAEADDTLPPGWISCPVSSIAEVRLGRQRSPSRATGLHMRPYVRAANVTWSGLDLTDVKEMDFTPEEARVYHLQPGDVLLGEASGSISEVGKPAIWNGEIEDCCFQNTLIRVRTQGPLPSYLYIHFLHDALTEQFRKVAKGVGIHHLGAEGLSKWMIRIPPLAEQSRIVEEVERRLSVIQNLQIALAGNLTRVERLRQSILKQAFEGKLVPQDPNDEPASTLLERIRVPQQRKERQMALPGI